MTIIGSDKMGYSERMALSGWIDASTRKPEDRDYVLIIHPDYETPMKALYRDDCPGASWIFYTRSGCHSVYEWETISNGDLIIRWWRPLPFIPKVYFEHLKKLKEEKDG